MKVNGTYFQNSADQPLVYGEVETINPPRRKLRGLEEKQGIIAESAFVGFCGTDFELMHMGQRGQLNAKFPAGQKRLSGSPRLFPPSRNLRALWHILQLLEGIGHLYPQPAANRLDPVPNYLAEVRLDVPADD